MSEKYIPWIPTIDELVSLGECFIDTVPCYRGTCGICGYHTTFYMKPRNAEFALGNHMYTKHRAEYGTSEEQEQLTKDYAK